MGRYSFEYSWELVDPRRVLVAKSLADSPIMSITPLEGTAEPNQRTMSELIFCPPTKLNLCPPAKSNRKGTELVLNVSKMYYQ